MSFKDIRSAEGIEWAIGSATRSLLARNAEITPANMLAELIARSSFKNPDEAARNKAAINWVKNRIN